MEAPAQQTKSARPRRRWLQYSLRSVLVIVTLSGVGLGLVVRRVERQRRAVAAVRAAGGTVYYDFEQSSSPAVGGELPGPDWLCRLLGVDYFAEVTTASLPDGATDATAAHLSGLTSLQELWLDGTQVGDAGLAHLSGLTSLQLLWLEGTRVTDAGLAHLSGLTSLQELRLRGTQVGDAGLAHLSGRTSLQSLDLTRTQVTDAGLAQLSGRTSLQWLLLGGTQVTDAGCRRLEAALPDCTIGR